MKQSVLVMWFAFVAGMVFGSGWVATGATWSFFGIAVIHCVEFVAKKSVMEQAGGSMGNHFFQTLIYGLFHWKPLEEQQAGAPADS